MKNAVRMMVARQESATRTLVSNIEDFEHRLARLKKALADGEMADTGFLQHTASFAEAAGTYNAYREALAMIAAVQLAERQGDE